MSYTLSYNRNVEGWTSFFSYKPEAMVGMNGLFYSFKGGQLYKHNSNEKRNFFYNVQYSSKITSVFNVEPLTVKNFKTIATYGNRPWTCTLVTDLSTGSIDKNYFVEKEGNWFAYIRSLPGDDNLRLRSAQGVGSVATVTNPGTNATVLNFSFNIGSMVSVGDMAYRNNSGTIEPIGVVTNTTINTITIDNNEVGLSTPTAGNYILYIRNSVAESYGARGYYMQYELENSSESRVELFSVKSNIFKSYP